MEDRSARSALTRSPAPLVAVLLSLALVVGGCSTGDTPPETSERDFEEGTLSSSKEPTSGLAETTAGTGQRTLLRVEGGKRTRFSGLCTAGNREYVISGSPSKTYAFEASSFSCRIKKQDPSTGNLKVTLVSGDSTRSVQQTNAQGSIVNVSHGE